MATVLLSCSATTEAPQIQKQVLPLDPPVGSNFTIDNQSSFTYSTVTINGVGQSMTVALDSIGPFYFTVPFTPISVTLNTTVCSYPDTTVVQFATAKVAAEWSSSSLMIILDYNGHD
jgi:hypothetical protein